MYSKTLHERVRRLLEDHPKTRDSDSTLIAAYCHYYWRDSRTITLHDYLDAVKQGKVPKWETLSRIRRKVQEENPHLVGKTKHLREKLRKEYQHTFSLG